jgi:hypothetical protein
MSPAIELLRRCSWQAEKLLKQCGHFRGVLWLAEYPNGQLERFETDCEVSPVQATDA